MRFPKGLRHFRVGLVALLSVLLLVTAVDGDILAAARSPVCGEKGMVVSVSPLASDGGLEILRRGGNAVDAAVAVAFLLAVVHPAAGNLGGGGFMTFHQAKRQQDYTLDFRERAPAAAHRDMYLNPEGELLEGASTRGHLASGVPGSVAGLHLAWKEFGSLPWGELLQPAITMAAEGFEVSPSLASSLQAARKLLDSHSESRRIFLNGGEGFQPGDRFRQPALAETLRQIARQGPDVFYRGEIARKIVAEMQRGGGLIAPKDLEEYRAVFREPMTGRYRGHEIVSMGPPSSGGIVLFQMLGMLERFPVSNLGFGSSRELHLKAEVMRRAFADRAKFLGDPDFVRMPLNRMLDEDYLRRRAETIRGDWATASQQLGAGDLPPGEPLQTTHFSVVDSARNAVGITTTLNGSYGSGVTIPGAGFLLNNEMDDFSSRPGAPNMFGLIQGEANSIQPGKRPLSSMMPTIVKRQGRPYLVTGSPGGPTIINSVFQVLVNVLDHGMNIQEAVDAPRIHHQWLPDRILMEDRAAPRDVVRALEDKGHTIDFRPEIGDAHSILIDWDSNLLLGAPDPRSDSKASSY